jgi:hypothetical protein
MKVVIHVLAPRWISADILTQKVFDCKIDYPKCPLLFKDEKGLPSAFPGNIPGFRLYS